LALPPLLHNSQVLIPAAALSPLFADELAYELRGKTCAVHASDLAVSGAVDGPDEANTGGELDFEDDPADPYKGDEGTDAPEAPTGTVLEEETARPVMRNMDLHSVIRRGKRYLGVKYAFGASPYPSSGAFDSSKFTQYVFSKYNVGLSRTARAQSKQGTAVGRKNLRKGDLMFFYVPGRYRSSKVVGHVGIYMGNQRMIHASPVPKNGVQITNINKAYWKQTFLGARRVAY
jgi:cell wall-associated NlpC family hydrolase